MAGTAEPHNREPQNEEVLARDSSSEWLR